MTKTCVICKRQHLSFDKTRSFHKFPNDSELQKKWMQLTGVSIISRNSTVCSDHFDALSFHQTDGYTTVRRLLSNAVPSIALNQMVSHVDTNDSSTSNSANDTLCANEKSCSEDIDGSDIGTETWNLHTSSTTAAQSLNELSMNISSTEEYENVPVLSSGDETDKPNFDPKDYKSYKRKRSVSDNENDIETQNKRFRFMYESQSYCMSREDFSSDEAWKKFIKFTLYKNAQVAAARQRRWRKEKKIGNMKDLIKSLKENQASAAAEYLEVH